MNTDNLNKWLTLAANFGVVAGIVFLGIEVRQNTIVTKLEAYNYFANENREMLDKISSDPILAPLLVATASGSMPEDFDEVENFRIRANHNSNLRVWEGLYNNVEAGVLPESSLGIIGRGGAFENPYFRSQWPRYRPSFSDDFVAYIEERIEFIE